MQPSITQGGWNSRLAVLEALAQIEADAWDAPRGERLLAYVRAHIVRPQVLGLGLRGLVADQAEAAAWEVAWDTLPRPGIRNAESPWGCLWVAVRPGVLGEVVSSAYLAGVRGSWRAEKARHMPNGLFAVEGVARVGASVAG